MEQMKSYIISYDLVGPARDYESLIDKIKSYGTWATPLESVWLIRSKKTAGEIRNDLKATLDSDDKLIVIEHKGGWASKGISKTVSKWMHDNF
ncbi:CRISPR-associated protein Cas2 [Planococcus sp. SIMBA_143]